ncbi:MAG: glycosyltransferase family 2 protein [Planctomycetia bacterium]|nr:glycosyltransferase family 2 protein [Planctomycetia bacterium]
MTRPTLSAALITLDEERRLPELLPLLSFADEIVVVDGGSRDATQQIAAAHGCRLIVHPFDSFAAQRNRAIDAACGQWILSIDADERPTPALVKEIRGLISRPRHAAYHVPIKSRIFGKPFRYSGTQDDRPVRLFRRDKARWTGDVHEVLAVEGAIGRVRAFLEHDTLPDLAAFLRKMHRYTSIEARRRVESGIAPHWTGRYVAPLWEVARRLIGKWGVLDGPPGIAFCALSGLSQWVLADKHARMWREAGAADVSNERPTSAASVPHLQTIASQLPALAAGRSCAA